MDYGLHEKTTGSMIRQSSILWCAQFDLSVTCQPVHQRQEVARGLLKRSWAGTQSDGLCPNINEIVTTLPWKCFLATLLNHEMSWGITSLLLCCASASSVVSCKGTFSWAEVSCCILPSSSSRLFFSIFSFLTHLRRTDIIRWCTCNL